MHPEASLGLFIGVAVVPVLVAKHYGWTKKGWGFAALYLVALVGVPLLAMAATGSTSESWWILSVVLGLLVFYTHV